MKIHALTRQGQGRERNEDRHFVKQFDEGTALVAVADGLGGHAGGEVAARLAMESLDDFQRDSEAMEEHLVELVLGARRKIAQRASEDEALRGMGTTLTVAFLAAGLAYWAQIGDSRVYLFRSGMLVQISDDQTVAGLLLSQGAISKEQARTHPMRGVLLSCIGSGEFEVDTGTMELEKNDLLILSTDGLHDGMSEEQFESILGAEPGLEKKLEALVKAVLDAGSADDMTVVVVEV